jgi:hypothetical protein
MNLGDVERMMNDSKDALRNESRSDFDGASDSNDETATLHQSLSAIPNLSSICHPEYPLPS